MGIERCQSRWSWLSVAAVAGRDGIAMRASFGMTQKGADALVELRADDVFEFAGLVVGFGIVDRECVFEKALGKAMTAHHVAGAAAARFGQANIRFAQLDEFEIGHAAERASGIERSWRSGEFECCPIARWCLLRRRSRFVPANDRSEFHRPTETGRVGLRGVEASRP